LPIVAAPLVLDVIQKCWLGPFAQPSSPQASRDTDTVESHGSSRRAGLFSAAAAVMAGGVGAPAGMAQVVVTNTAEKTANSPMITPGAGSGLFRFNRQDGFVNADPIQLASRVITVPPNPDSCQGADDGDLVGIKYAAAWELEGMKGAPVDTPTEASIDLIDDDDADLAKSRWAVFDSSERRQGAVPFQIPLGGSNTILGLDMALHGLCRGERRVIYIPANLGGNNVQRRSMGLPDGANLRYDVEVTNVITFQRPRAKQGTPPEKRRIVGRLVQ